MNIQNLVFFKTDGTQIPTQYTNNMTFAVIGNMSERADRGYGWRKDSKGYFVLGEKGQVVGISMTDKGSTYGFYESIENIEDAIYSLVDEIVVSFKNDEFEQTVSFLKEEPSRFRYSVLNEETDEEEIRYKDVAFDEIFDITIGKNEISVKSETSEKDNLIYEYNIESVIIKEEYKETFIDGFFNIPEGVSVYPCQQFMSQLMMEKVSTELVSSETIFVLEKRMNSKGVEGYYRPRSSTQNLRFQFPEDSDTMIVKTAEEFYKQDRNFLDVSENEYDYSKVYWSDYISFDLINEYNDTEDSTEPIFFTMGFSSKYEGCFQDTLSIKTVDGILGTDDLKFNNIGFMMVKNETVGEDERYRTLFTNFGIPDPADYQEVFKDSEIMQEGKDWDFLNNKSKELFLSYHEIFPYIGSYKALLNAVKFLGYDDIYFKEWYKFFDGTKENKISYKSVDINTMMPLQSKLAKIGVSLEEFLNWKKLSQLSIIYLMNRQESEQETLESFEVVDGQKTNVKTKTFVIPSTKPVYTYLNSQILAKLYSLKEWLENYILNINCQIIDVDGEGVYFERYKSQAHVAPLYTNFTAVKESQISPTFSDNKGDKGVKLEMGQTPVFCTLKEFEDNQKFFDFQGISCMDVIKKIQLENNDKKEGDGIKVDVDDNLFSDKKFVNEHFDWLKDIDSLSEDDIKRHAKIVVRGGSFSNNTPFYGVKYELETSVDSGSFREGVGYINDEGKFVNTPIITKDNEVFIYGHKEKEVGFVKGRLPVIRLSAGKLRKPFGKWRNNILFKIQGYFDTERTKSRFCIQSVKNNSQEVSDDYITLYPKKGEQYHPSFKYTEKNKYGVPLFILEDYDTFNGFLESNSALGKFIIEIDEGYIDSYETAEGDENNICIARMVFEQDFNRNNANEQKIYMKYIYQTPRTSLETVSDNSVFESKPYFDQYDTNVEKLKNELSEVERLTFESSEYNSDSTNPLLSDIRLKDIKEEYNKNCSRVEGSIDTINEFISKYTDLIGRSEEGSLLNRLYQSKIDRFKKMLELYNKEKDSVSDVAFSMFDELQDYWLERLSVQKINEVKNLSDDILNNFAEKTNLKYHNNIVVNHVGEYNLTAIATDSYNMPFAQKSQSKLKVNMTPPTVFVNTYTEEDSEFETTVEKFDGRPWFVPEYFRNVLGVDSKNSSLTYEDFSYYNDSPKKNEFIHLSNTTERIDSFDDSFDVKEYKNEGFVYDKNRVYLKIVMNDENPGNQNIFYKGGELFIVFVDKNSTEIANFNGELEITQSKVSGPYRVEDYYNPYRKYGVASVVDEDDEREENDNYIILSYDPSNLDFVAVSSLLKELLVSGEVLCFANMQTRYEISLENIHNDKKNRTCTIQFADKLNGPNMMFSKGQTVKIFYSALTCFGFSEGGAEDNEFNKETFISGTTYKIIECGYDSINFVQTYTIDGMINTDLIELRKYKNGIYNNISDVPSENFLSVPYKVRCTISPAHWMYTSYDVISVQDADENNLNGYFEFTDDWNGCQYIDNTFAFTKRKFKVLDAYRDWKTDFVQEDKLYAHSNAVTEYKDDNEKTISVYVNSFDLANSFDDNEYSCIWDVFYNPGQDKKDEYLLYQLTNKELVLNLKMEGEYRFRLTAIDKYGNSVVNNKQGYLKIVNRK